MTKPSTTWATNEHGIHSPEGQLRLLVVPTSENPTKEQDEADQILALHVAHLLSQSAGSEDTSVIFASGDKTVHVTFAGDEANELAERIEIALQKFSGVPTEVIREMPGTMAEFTAEFQRMIRSFEVVNDAAKSDEEWSELRKTVLSIANKHKAMAAHVH